MAVKIKAQMTGVAEVMASLKALDGKMRKKILQKALRAAVKPVVKAAQAKCPVDPDPRLIERGLLKKSLGLKMRVYKDGSVVLAVVGARKNFKRRVKATSTQIAAIAATITGTGRARQRAIAKALKSDRGQAGYQDPSKIAHLVEFGTVRAKAKPFLRPAWDETVGQATEIFKNVVRSEITQ